MSHAYRSAYQHIVGMRLAEMKLAREMLEPILPRLRSVRAARIARILAGSVGLAAAAAMVLVACIGDDGESTYALIGGGTAAITTYLVVRLFLGIGFRRFTRPVPKLTGDLDEDLARIAASDPLREVERRFDSLELWSTALPLAAISLLMPLTLHYTFMATTLQEPPAIFGKWIAISLVIVGHAHLALMAQAIAFARKMRTATAESLAQMRIHREWAKAWGITIGVAALPGALLVGIPPLLTAITGLAFIPFMFALMRRRVMSERSVLELAAEAVHVRVDADAAPAALEEAAWSEIALTQEREAGAATARL